jgi:hypothetical protein
LQATVAGVPAVLYPRGEKGEWELMLGPDRLPQTVRVVYVKEVTGTRRGGESSVAAPVLKGIRVDRTLWSHYPLGGTAAARNSPAGARVGRLSQDLTRLATGLSMMDLPPDVLTETPPGELMQWYLRWTREQAAVLRRIDYATGALGREDHGATSLKAEWEAQRQQWAKRFGSAAASSLIDDDVVAVYEPAEIFATMTTTPRTTTHLSWKGKASQMAVNGPQGSMGDFWLRLASSFCLLLGVAVLCVVNRHRPIRDFFLSYPRLVGVLVGLAWWLWLTPSLVGWIIVAVSLLPAVRRFSPVASEPDSTRTGTLPLRSG